MDHRTGLLIALGFFGSLFTVGCTSAWADSVKGSGVAKTEARDVGAFTRIRLDGSADVKVTIGDKPSLTVSGDDNILPLIDTKVEDNQLVITSHQSISPKLPLKVEITTPSLGAFAINGSGDVKITGLNEKEFAASIRGSGDMTATGAADSLKVEIKGSGDAKLDGLTAKTAAVSVSGSGDVQVNASDSLTATVAGSGDVHYKGDPKELVKSVAGSGSVTRG